MSLLIYSLPALGWGLMPIVSKKAGGTPVEQLLGTTFTAFGISIILSFLMGVEYTLTGTIAALISGSFWAGGQYLQFQALATGAVSKVMPLSNGTQLLFTSLASGILLREWQNLKQVLITLLLLLVILVAIYLVTMNQNQNKQQESISLQTILMICTSSLCLMGYVVTTSLFHVKGLQIFLPQAFAMFLSSCVIAKFDQEKQELSRISRNVLTGIFWTIANISLFYIATQLGVGLSYTISQLCIFVSIMGGILLLKEKRPR
ncbi:multidrug DMT transporter permease [Enterococcus faecalis]|uniref:GRP family sugar transporter n=1 Tax=Enterococcus gallinarum TaxID=1353 RepID=UPI0010746EF4|nr:GRP family sugar transporter [Enterococcus gallinarum]MBF0796985.1 multidrug DMT transporter permease [Enterococcus gallinarum]MBF0820195.1 multidrug DMT transporter permease [Enterococcus faecalis]MBX8976311.1 multidrug DMT transporter permease [Enterococcus gallinarum]TFV18797.1 multidrug DMT transporter permease [Enterococcus gallinarum]